ncbi:MAG TPA: helix-turn-helix domain-containing protein [Candidatus Micrarchaeia archaeon]|nr:helix-turn-helix domain-containing protein [Candidatus Micrarchaeia archaeon]
MPDAGRGSGNAGAPSGVAAVPAPAEHDASRTDSHPAPGTAARILDGAQRAFAATGYHGTTVPAIAAAAGVSVGLIYRYFTSKAELFLAICASQSAAGTAARAVELTAIGDPRVRLAEAVSTFVSDLATGSWAGVKASAFGEAEQNPRVRELLRLQSDQAQETAALLLRDAIRRGDAPSELPVGPLARAIGMLFDGAMLARVAAGDAFDRGAVATAITTIIGSALGWT